MTIQLGKSAALVLALLLGCAAGDPVQRAPHLPLATPAGRAEAFLVRQLSGDGVWWISAT